MEGLENITRYCKLSIEQTLAGQPVKYNHDWALKWKILGL